MDSTTQNSIFIEEGEKDPELVNEKYPFVRFSGDTEQDGKGGNPYLSQLPALDPSDPPPVCFAGFGTGKELCAQLQAIQCSETPFGILLLPEKVWKEPEMQDFLAEEDCMTVRISSPDNGYFGKVLRTCLKDTGFSLPAEQDIKEVIGSLRQNYGSAFSEIHVIRSCKQAIEHACMRKSTKLTVADLLGYDAQEPVLVRIGKMIGLEDFKRVLEEFRAVQMATLTNPALSRMHRNMIFYGNPGTGKSVCAGLVGDALREAGLGNGRVVVADRASIIGKYVGHTAPKIEELFKKAAGGVLLVDEAGFFLTEDGKKGFAGEAIKEFVRYMEVYPDVTVIFAMYEKEMSAFLQLDEGLRSRISRRVRFPDYDTGQLCDITEFMLKQYGYELGPGAKERIRKFFDKRNVSFGNARGARKLTEYLITTSCVDAVAKKRFTEKCSVVTKEQVDQTVARMIGNDPSAVKHSFGFAAVQEVAR